AVDRVSLPSEIRKRIRDAIGRSYRTYPGVIPLLSFVGSEMPADAAPAARRRGRRRTKNPGRDQG
ncbi:MAG: hypothetical protein LBR87_08380, partial [Synergistaceae bacterium]|nr:hypothetical protein [Synergistaceae bacterium]